MREASRGRRPAGLSVHAVFIGPFPNIERIPNVGVARTDREGLGVEACLAVQPRGTWLPGPVGGCVLSVTHLWRQGTGDVLFVGTNPRLELSPPNSVVAVSVGAVAALGASTQGSDAHNQTDYYLAGVTGHLAAGIPYARSRAIFDLEAGVVRVWVEKDYDSQPRLARVTPRLAAGLRYAL